MSGKKAQKLLKAIQKKKMEIEKEKKDERNHEENQERYKRDTTHHQTKMKELRKRHKY